jgi:hypothetical protein
MAISPNYTNVFRTLFLSGADSGRLKFPGYLSVYVAYGVPFGYASEDDLQGHE